MGDGGDLPQLLGHARLECGSVVAVADAVEGRQLEGKRARRGEGVFGHGVGPFAAGSGDSRGGKRGRGEGGG